MKASLVLVLVLAAAGCRVPYAGDAHPVAASDSLNGYLRASPTPVVRQRQETDCGLAALAMIAGAWGQRWSVDDLARVSPPTQRGVRLGALRSLARSRGLDAYAIAATRDDIAHELRAGRPILLGLVLPFEGDRYLGHYEVAIALDPRGGDVITLDPATGKAMRRSPKALESEWARAHHAALVVTGNLARTVLVPTVGGNEHDEASNDPRVARDRLPRR